MLGRVVEGRHTGCILDRIGDKGAMFILLEDGQKAFLQRNTIEKISSLMGPNGEKMVRVHWKNGMSSLIRLGEDPESAAPEAPAFEPAPAYAPVAAPAYIPVTEPVAPAYTPAAVTEPIAMEEPAAPAFESEPAQEPEAPAFTPAPAFATEELKDPAPAYEPESAYRTAPLFEQEPAEPEAPAYQAPMYQDAPPAYEPPMDYSESAPGYAPPAPAYQGGYEPQAPAAPVSGEPFFNKKLLKILLLAMGVLALILALVVFSMDIGYFESSYTYGGDAYTGIQNAAAQTANNVKDLASIVQTGFASVLMVMGGTMISFGVCIDTKKKK